MKITLAVFWVILLYGGNAIGAELCETREPNIKVAELYETKVLAGEQMLPLLPFIAEQRINFFKNFPEFYHGTMESEQPYLTLYSSWKDTAVALVYHYGKPVGLISGMPLIKFDEHCPSKELFKKMNLSIESFYYFPEVIVLPEHRGKGLKRVLLQALEKHAQSLGYSNFALLTTNPVPNDPRKPSDYKDSNWQTLGYTKTSLIAHIPWDTILPDGSVKMHNHVLTYWLKQA